MNLSKIKNWKQIDVAKGGYAETAYEFFVPVYDIPLLKLKGKNVWYIGHLYNKEKPKIQNLLYDLDAALKAFDEVKKFQESELETRHRFERMSKEELENWINELGTNFYIGDSIYRKDALAALKEFETKIIKKEGVKMDDKLIAVVKYPYEKPQTIALEKGLKPLQDIVGGSITGADLPDIEGVYGFVNDEGLLIGLEPNIYRPEWKDALVGPLVFVGAGDDGEDVGLTPEQVKKVTAYLEHNSVTDFSDFLFHIETGFAFYQPKEESEEQTGFKDVTKDFFKALCGYGVKNCSKEEPEM